MSSNLVHIFRFQKSLFSHNIKVSSLLSTLNSDPDLPGTLIYRAPRFTGRNSISPEHPGKTGQPPDLPTGLGNKVILVDARPVARYPEALPGAVRMFTDKMRPDDVIANLSGDETLVTYCMKGILSFRGAKALRDAGWTGQLYFIDNGGFTELKELF
eukprot:sb/3473134/